MSKKVLCWLACWAFFASVKGEIKYASDRSSEVVEYRLKRLPELVGICNSLIDLCSRTLQKAEGKEWLLLIEDLDKTGISPPQLQELFIQYGTVFQDLRVNLIFTIPVWLAYSTDANRLPFDKHMIPDTPVYDRQHEPHELGRAAIRAVLEARMLPQLFAEGQMTKLIIASGGNIRDLFSLALDAAEFALLRDTNSSSIAEADCIAAINSMRRDYRRKLGQSPYDPESITYEQKLKKLLAVYHRSANSDIPDPALYSKAARRRRNDLDAGWLYCRNCRAAQVVVHSGTPRAGAG